MAQRPSCRGCRHCTPPVDGQPGWCQLRQLAIHPDLASELWCHHWTARLPQLPRIGDGNAAPGHPPNRQLTLTNVIPEP